MKGKNKIKWRDVTSEEWWFKNPKTRWKQILIGYSHKKNYKITRKGKRAQPRGTLRNGGWGGGAKVAEVNSLSILGVQADFT